MQNLAVQFDRMAVEAAGIVPKAAIAGLVDDDLLALTAAVERLGRAVDGLRVVTAAEVGDRSRRELGSEGLAVRKGCRNPVELLQRVTLISALTAHQRLKLGKDLQPATALTGEVLPARFPKVADAITTGRIGIDAATAIVKGLQPAFSAAHPVELAAAETELVAAATGMPPSDCTAGDGVAAGDDGPDVGPDGVTEELPVSGAPSYPCPADELAIQAAIWRAVLDPDGLQPSEERAMRNRLFSRGRLRDGLVHGTYALLPEIAAKLDRLFDAYLAPKTTGVFLTDAERLQAEASGDTRSTDQQRHDVFATMIDSWARSGNTPTLGGAAPTVLVSVTAEDLTSGRGAGWIDGLTDPISMAAVNQFACTGGIQPVSFDSFGRIIALGSPQRSFTPAQRKAISLRDGGCLIDDCNIPAGWCEIHHVQEASRDGETHTDNGVLLCWFHHRTIDSSGWQIQMIRGAPHLKAPPWLDRTGRWKPVSKARTRISARKRS
ncbi:HNH endonuclease signature motif containing protein [Diaminobutyricimonas sp. LJ205]|uniref:HNH endonuclease signature motif containing protein n=1 Tax=Diaminobutyricimonas sp. LJ205 TaxID=2683590 RepID=UPI0012F4EFD0|nr:HNH endonuclease signature motif containing protein [Diaminobutyricimonas sp. LJ205]